MLGRLIPTYLLGIMRCCRYGVKRRNEPANMIEITESAATKIKDLLEEQGKSDHALRIFVRGMSCSGRPMAWRWTTSRATTTTRSSSTA